VRRDRNTFGNTALEDTFSEKIKSTVIVSTNTLFPLQLLPHWHAARTVRETFCHCVVVTWALIKEGTKLQSLTVRSNSIFNIQLSLQNL
ncbi:hypothetical protein K0M31_016737, partial [Melipona bicolor]